MGLKVINASDLVNILKTNTPISISMDFDNETIITVKNNKDGGMSRVRVPSQIRDLLDWYGNTEAI